MVYGTAPSLTSSVVTKCVRMRSTGAGTRTEYLLKGVQAALFQVCTINELQLSTKQLSILHLPSQQPTKPLSRCLTACARVSASRRRRRVSTITLAVTQAKLTQPSVTPDSQKSTTDKISENVSGAGDRIAGAVQPGSYPSFSRPCLNNH